MSKIDPADPSGILIVAEHASAKFGGEALIPFQYFKFMREKGVDVHLLVHARVEPELTAAFPGERRRLHFVPDSLVNIWCHKLSRFLPRRLAEATFGFVSHLETQIRQRRMAKRLIRELGIRLVHEPIPVSPKLPSMSFGLGAPVIIGPMNGGMNYPPQFSLESPTIRRLVSMLRSTSGLVNLLLPGKRRAALLLVANQRTLQALPAALRARKTEVLVENGVDLAVFHPAERPSSGGPFRLVFVGRLIDLKCVDLLLEACARLQSRHDFVLEIIGDGPMKPKLLDQTQRLALADRVAFRGMLSQPAVAEALRNADAMVLPSVLEAGGAVVLEAMASGIPVIAANWGGPADYITEETGILVPVKGRQEFVDGLEHAIVSLLQDRAACERMGKAGYKRVCEQFDWRVKTELLMRIYAKVRRAPLPVA